MDSTIVFRPRAEGLEFQHSHSPRRGLLVRARARWLAGTVDVTEPKGVKVSGSGFKQPLSPSKLFARTTKSQKSPSSFKE